MFLVTRSQSAVLFFREWASLLAARLLKEGFPVRKAGADSRGKVGLGVGVVLFVCVWKVCSEPGET